MESNTKPDLIILKDPAIFISKSILNYIQELRKQDESRRYNQHATHLNTARQRTYDSSLSEGNYSIITVELGSGYRCLAQQVQELVELIHHCALLE